MKCVSDAQILSTMKSAHRRWLCCSRPLRALARQPNTRHTSLLARPILTAAELIGVFQSTILAQSRSKTKERPATKFQICDLLRRIDAFDGKLFAVRGMYCFSKELAGLYSEGCQKQLILDGVERAQALDVGKSPEERAELEHFTNVVSYVAKSGKLGTLINRNPQLHRLGNGKGDRLFGHLGVYPARLEVSSIRNVRVVENAPSPSNMELRK